MLRYAGINIHLIALMSSYLASVRVAIQPIPVWAVSLRPKPLHVPRCIEFGGAEQINMATAESEKTAQKRTQLQVVIEVGMGYHRGALYCPMK